MGSLALDVWDVAKRGDPAPLSRMGKLVRRGRRILTGGGCHGPRADWAARVTVAHGYCSAAAQLRFSPRLETERELDRLK